MVSASVTKRYSAAQLARVRAKTAAELKDDTASNPDFRDVPNDWDHDRDGRRAEAEAAALLQIDDEVEWFKQPGPGTKPASTPRSAHSCSMPSSDEPSIVLLCPPRHRGAEARSE